MMKMLNTMDFITNLGGIKICDLHLSMYVNNEYDCACGEKHMFTYDSEIICQGAWKLVLECPVDNNYVTCVQLKTKFLGMGFSGFESIYGTRLVEDYENENSRIGFNYIIKKHIGEI